MSGQGSCPTDPVKSVVTSSPQHVEQFQCCSETQITELSNDSSAEASKLGELKTEKQPLAQL